MRYIIYKVVIFLLMIQYSAAQDIGLTKVAIDPGHGGRDPGAIGAASREKDIVLDVALRLGKMIEEAYPDVKVVYTRKTDVFIPLDKRGEIANKAKADLFISVHANASPSKNPYGAETFVMGNSKSSENMEVAKRENSVILIEDDYSTRYEGFDPNSSESYIYFSLLQNAYLNQSLGFASKIQEHFKGVAERMDRGVKQAGFLVLWKTTMPSVLVELGFISNTNEEKYMNSDKGKENLALSIFQAFSEYKEQVEERSSFKPDAPSRLPVEDTGTPQAAPENKIEASTQVQFCIQIGTSSRSMDTNPNNFKKHKGVERIQISSTFYKYVLGRTSDYNEAQKNLQTIRKDFPDAFVVGINSGKIIPVAEALKLLGKK